MNWKIIKNNTMKNFGIILTEEEVISTLLLIKTHMGENNQEVLKSVAGKIKIAATNKKIDLNKILGIV